MEEKRKKKKAKKKRGPRLSGVRHMELWSVSQETSGYSEIIFFVKNIIVVYLSYMYL